MEQQYLRIHEVCTILAISKATIYRMVNDGHFPPPTRLGKRKSRWHIQTVQTWIGEQEQNLDT